MNQQPSPPGYDEKDADSKLTEAIGEILDSPVQPIHPVRPQDLPPAPPAGQPLQNMAGQQPGAPGAPGAQVQWMQKPQAMANCPPGLEYLTQVDQLLVHQQVELLEAFTSWEASNKYQVKNSVGQQVYFAAEESNTCSRQCCGAARGFTMHITDNFGQEVIRVIRPLKLCACCNCCAGCTCAAMEVDVEAPVGTKIGSIRQTCSFFAPKYDVLDAEDNVVLCIEGPMCICQGALCTWDQEFNVFSRDRDFEVGTISKQWTGLVKEVFTDADNFGVAFPMDLDVKIKGVLLGAVFLIDFMFFEQSDSKKKD